MSSQAFSIWGSRFSDEGGQNLVSYLSRKDTAEVDVGDILAVAGKALPYIPPNRLTFDKALGRGTSFQVNREVYSKPGYSGYYVAVKYLQTSTDSTFERRRRYAAVLREVRVLTHLALRGNACVMPALGYGWQSDRLEGAQPYLVVDYSDHGTLPQYLRRCKIPLHERIELAIDIASALQSLHACKIIHGDVKPENIIVYDHGGDLPERPQAAKLADFGCSIFELDFKQGSDVYYLGTPKYNAPEINGRVGSQVEAYDSSIVAFALADVYSYGLFLWEVLKNGQDYLDPSWFRDGEDGGDCITRICATEVDGILERASSFYDNELATNKTSTFPDTLKQALALALRDRRSLRGSMDEIFHVLTTEFGHRPPRLQYPPTVQRPIGVHYLDPSEVDIVPSRITRNESKPKKSQAPMHRVNKQQPSVFQDHNFRYRSLDLLQISKERPLPWDVQCDTTNNLKEATWLDTSEDAARAHFQIAIAYRIGFGIHPDVHKVRHHLHCASSQDQSIKTIFERIQSGLDQELSDSESCHGASPLPSLPLGGVPVANDFSDFFRATHTLRYNDVVGPSPLPIRKILQEATGYYQDVTPTPLHWLILLGTSDARNVLESYYPKQALQANHSVNVLDLSTSNPVALPGFFLDLFGTPLHWAVRTAHVGLVHLLIEFGANVNTRWKQTGPSTQPETVQRPDLSPLDLAVTYHLTEIASILLDAGAEVYGGGMHGDFGAEPWRHSALHTIGAKTIPFSRLIIHGKDHRAAAQSSISLLLSRQDNIWRPDSEGHTPLSRALENTTVEGYIIEQLVAAGARMYGPVGPAQDSLATIVARTSFERRFSSWKLELVKELLQDINVANSEGNNPLHIAAMSGSYDVAQYLLGLGADVDARSTDASKRTPLMFAAIHGSITVLHALLEAGAILDLPDNSGKTALELAVGFRQLEVASALIDAGSRTSFEVSDGISSSTILHAATKNMDRKDSLVAELLKRYPSQAKQCLNVADHRGWTPMHHAGYFGDLEGTKAMLSAGALAGVEESTTVMTVVQGAIEDIERQGLGPDHEAVRQEGQGAQQDLLDRLYAIKIEIAQHEQYRDRV